MITVNGKQFARNDAEFTDTLFTRGSTAYGFYKVLKRGGGKCIHLMDMQGRLFAAIVGNKHGETFFVDASTLDNGKAYYMHSTSQVTEDALSLPSNLRDQSDLASLVLGQV